jgi:phospho-2-dehydro-3-deoxyheptonate aldolase
VAAVLFGFRRPSSSSSHFALQASADQIRANVTPKLIIDCSHGNSSKNHNNQVRSRTHDSCTAQQG